MRNLFEQLIAPFVLLLLIMCGFFVVNGCSVKEMFNNYPKDNAVEEFVEDRIEDGLEGTFNLPAGTLDGTIDFTPGDDD